MAAKIKLLDCTLRDGAYIVDSMFGTHAIKGIISKLSSAKVDLIECGWLKDKPHSMGSTFFNVPEDAVQYYDGIESDNMIAMIDYNRYDLSQLPDREENYIGAIRVVFPRSNFKDGIALCDKIKEKGYNVYLQAANTLAYTDAELLELATLVNEAKPVALSIVDTFGAMYSDDLEHIASVFNRNLDKDVALGFHSHNNQQLSFSLSIKFVELMMSFNRDCIVDSSLLGMGRGAGNTTTELMSSYLNRKHNKDYDMPSILDAIDNYMFYFDANYEWGYSKYTFLGGLYCTHVNNVAYLLSNHRTNAKDMNNIIASMDAEDRLGYNYDLLERKYIEYRQNEVTDEASINAIKDIIGNRKVLILLPGASLVEDKSHIDSFIKENNPYVIAVNTDFNEYAADCILFTSELRYNFFIQNAMKNKDRLIVASSNISVSSDINQIVVNYNSLIKSGWKNFDNSGLMCLRMLARTSAANIYIAGMDGYSGDSKKDYFNKSSELRLSPVEGADFVNREIQEMLDDFRNSYGGETKLTIITPSLFC